MQVRTVIVSLLVVAGLYLFTLTFLSKGYCPLRGQVSSEKFPASSVLTGWGQSQAVPVFARKYGASCQSCHTAFPNLTPFGEAFKRNGLRFPGEGTVFESPNSMTLGEETDKEKFPKAVWPGALPKSLPFSFTGLSQFVSQPRNGANNQRAQFQQFGGQVGVLAVGTLGNHFAYWGGVGFMADIDLDTGTKTFDVELERTYAVINPLKNHSNLVIRIGSFEPHLLNVSVHRGLLGGYFATTDRSIGSNAYTLEDTQQGIELGGTVAKGRLGYTFGVVEGAGNRYNNYKDFYGRLEYKLGGLRFDGIEDDKSKTTEHPWRDDSVTFGGFGYLGFATLVNAAGAEQQDRFYILGTDVNVNYRDFILNLGYLRQQNNRPLLATPTISVDTNQFFAEVNYVYFWFLPSIRYEFFDNSQTRDHRLTFGSTFLIRPNIKTFIRGSLTKVAGGSFTDNPEIRAGLMMAF